MSGETMIRMLSAPTFFSAIAVDRHERNSFKTDVLILMKLWYLKNALKSH